MTVSNPIRICWWILCICFHSSMWSRHQKPPPSLWWTHRSPGQRSEPHPPFRRQPQPTHLCVTRAGGRAAWQGPSPPGRCAWSGTPPSSGRLGRWSSRRRWRASRCTAAAPSSTTSRCGWLPPPQAGGHASHACQQRLGILWGFTPLSVQQEWGAKNGCLADLPNVRLDWTGGNPQIDLTHAPPKLQEPEKIVLMMGHPLSLGFERRMCWNRQQMACRKRVLGEKLWQRAASFIPKPSNFGEHSAKGVQSRDPHLTPSSCICDYCGSRINAQMKESRVPL